MNIKHATSFIVAALIAVSLVGCADEDKAAPQPSATVAVETEAAPAPTPTEHGASLLAVEQEAVELYRLTVPNDPSTDDAIIAAMEDKGDEIVAYMNDGGTSSDFLAQEATNEPDKVVANQALLAGAIALDPSIANHENY